jgi:hypothetical protein
MRKWMDEVRFDVIPEPGRNHPRNVLTMTKRRETGG